MEEQESFKIGQEPCPKCREMGNDNSGDNLVVYSDGHKYCFACQYFVQGDTEMEYTEPVRKEFTPINGSYEPIPSRGLDEKTCRKFGYTVARKDGKVYHIASAYKNRELIGQHIRQEDPKDFRWVGSPRGAELFGQHLFEKGGKRIVVTEGEIDAMTVYQVNNGWPVVSLPNGVQSAVRSVKDNLEFLSSYDEVIFMFDNDDAGNEAATEVAAILPPGKAKIATLPRKDANECLMNGQSKDVVSAIWQAHPFRPDALLHVSEIEFEEMDYDSVIPYPWDSLNRVLIGDKAGCINLWASGTGSGKSTILRELAWYHISNNRKVGMVMLEESPQETKDDMISLMINAPVKAIKANMIANESASERASRPSSGTTVTSAWTSTRMLEAAGQYALHLYNHKGNKDTTSIMDKIRYLAVSEDCEVIILDHITALATAMLDDKNSNERILLDNLMQGLESLAENTGTRIHIVTQLKKTDRAFEEGSRITLQDLKGAGTLGSVPDNVIGLERNRQDPDPTVANTTGIRVLKNRLTGETGVAGAFYYDKSTGRLSDVAYQEDDKGRITPDLDPFKEKSD